MGLLLHRVSVEIDGGSLAPSFRLLVFFTHLRLGLLLGRRLGYGRDWLSMESVLRRFTKRWPGFSPSSSTVNSQLLVLGDQQRARFEDVDIGTGPILILVKR